MSAVTVELPNELQQRLEKIAEQSGISLNHLLIEAAEKMSQIEILEQIKREAATRDTRRAFEKVLAAVPDVEPSNSADIIRKKNVEETKRTAGKFVLLKNRTGEYHFHFAAPNGQIILSSKTYETKAAALNGIESVRSSAGEKNRFKVLTNTNNQSYFLLSANNGEIIARSENYSSVSATENAIEWVKNNTLDSIAVSEDS